MSLLQSPAQPHGTVYGGHSPQRIGTSKQNPKPTDSMQVTPSLLMTASLDFSTRRHNVHTQMCMEFYTHFCAYAFYREKKKTRMHLNTKK